MRSKRDLSRLLDSVIEFERGDIFYRRLHPGTISTYFPHRGVPPRGSPAASDFAKVLASTNQLKNMKPSTTYAEYQMWKKALAQNSIKSFPGIPSGAGRAA